jgi:hypothetical protein
MITEGQQAEAVFKVLRGKASTNADRTASEEPLSSTLIFTPQNFWIDAELIPPVAPLLADRGIYSTVVNTVRFDILKYFENVPLTPVSGSSNAFYCADLKDSIPYSQDSNGSYLYSLKDATGTQLAFGLNNWMVDNQAGVVTFYDGVPAGITIAPDAPLTITFYKYIGRKSLKGFLRSDGSVPMDAEYSPRSSGDVVNLSYLNNQLQADKIRFANANILRPDGSYVTTTNVQTALADLYRNKADVIDNIVPLAQLPDFPTGPALSYSKANGTFSLLYDPDSLTISSSGDLAVIPYTAGASTGITNHQINVLFDANTMQLVQGEISAIAPTVGEGLSYINHHFELVHDGTLTIRSGSLSVTNLPASTIDFSTVGVSRPNHISVTASNVQLALEDIYATKADLDSIGKLDASQLPIFTTSAGLAYDDLTFTLLYDPSSLGINSQHQLYGVPYSAQGPITLSERSFGLSIDDATLLITAQGKLSAKATPILVGDGLSYINSRINLKLDPNTLAIDSDGRVSVLSTPTTASGTSFNTSGVSRPDGVPISAANVQAALTDVYSTKADLVAGKIPLDQIPDSISSGGMVYKGIWVFDSNAGAYPTAADLSGTDLKSGWFVLVGPSPSNPESPTSPQIAIDGVEYSAGDWSVWNGTAWNKVDNSYANASYSILPNTPPDGSWNDGLLSLGGTTIVDGMDQVNEILLKLAPPKPINLSAMNLSFKSGTTQYSAAEAGTGTVRSPVVSTTQPILTTPIAPDSISTLFYYNTGDILSATIDGSSAGSMTLAESNNVGVQGALTVVANNDPWAGTAGKQNFWLGLRAEIHPSALSLGAHSLAVSDTTSGTTPSFQLYVDNPSQSMLISGASLIVKPVMSKYLSGVPSITPASIFTISAFDAVNVVGRYYNSTAVASISCNVSGVSTVNSPAATVPATPPPGTYANTSVASRSITMPSSAYNENVSFTLTPYNSQGSSGTVTVLPSLYRIDTTIETERSYSGDPTLLFPPSASILTFDSTKSLAASPYTGELQKLNGGYQWPANVSYSSYIGTNGAGPDYTGLSGATITGKSGLWRWVTFKLPNLLSSNLAFTLTFTNPTGFSADTNQVTANMMIFVKVVGASSTGWINGNAAYPGAGIPFNDNDAAMSSGDSSASVKRITFGPAVRTGDCYIRIAVEKTSGIQFSAITISSLA